MVESMSFDVLFVLLYSVDPSIVLPKTAIFRGAMSMAMDELM